MNADEMTAWLRKQVEADKAYWERWLTQDVIIRRDHGEEHVADCEAKLQLLDRYDKAAAGGDLSYDYRTGRHSRAQILWNALLVLTLSYRHREGWRDQWPVPGIFQ